MNYTELLDWASLYPKLGLTDGETSLARELKVIGVKCHPDQEFTSLHMELDHKNIRKMDYFYTLDRKLGSMYYGRVHIAIMVVKHG